MESKCTCLHCSNSIIFRFNQLQAGDLVDEGLCASFSTFHFVSCAKRDCAEVDCHAGKFKQLLYKGVGCYAFNGKSNADVAFKLFETIPCETDDGKKRNDESCSRASESYNKFRKRLR